MEAGLYPVSLALTLILGALLLAAPRRWALLPILLAAIFIPPDQRIVVATLDFTMIRILILFGALRVLLRGEGRSLEFQRLDTVILAFVTTLFTTSALLYASVPILVNRLGAAFDLIGMYFYCRVALRRWEDLGTALWGAMGCCALLAVFMTIESTTGRNLFSEIGGVPDITVVRDGRLRCQGAFAHPILAGLFGASWVPLFASLFWTGRRELALLGAGLGVWIVVLSASSTPLLALAAGLLGIAMWPLRGSMRAVRWGTLVTLVVLHLVRDRPVWHLLARINVVGGSTGWHRYQVIDAAIAHFDEWWLLGTAEITHWHVHWNDITNQFVAAGINGGLLAMLLFIFILVAGFSGVGSAATSRALAAWQRRFAWGLGALLFLYTSAFFAVSLFGQMTFVWYQQLAMVASTIELAHRARRARVTAPQP